MKKVLLIIISVFALLTITGCVSQPQVENMQENPNESEVPIISENPKEPEETPKAENPNAPEGLTMTLKSLSVEKAVFTVTNNTSKSYYYRPDDSLEKKENNEWKIVPPKESMSYAAVIETLDAYSSIEVTLDIEFVYGKLSSGTYRFVKEFTNNQEAIKAKAEFNVVDTY